MPSLASIIGSRIYFSNPSQLSQYPCLTVNVGKREYGYNLAGHDGTSLATIDITAYSLTEASAIAIAEIIRNNFQGFRGTQSGVAILRCFLDDESDDTSQPIDGSDQWIYECSLSYVVKHRVPVPTNVTQTDV
jgi:hypothetical protein